MEEQKQRILMAKKPQDVADIYKQTNGRISPAELAELVKDEHIEDKTCKDWEELCEADLSESQFWRVSLEKEDELILVDTSGYDYPRYAGLLERESDEISLKEKVDAYKKHFFATMNDLSKDELIQQIWNAKSKEEKFAEAIKFSRTMDW